MDEKKRQMQIELDEKTAQGTYANFAVITHSQAEFILDFTRVLPGVPKAKVQSRILMTPQHAKALLMALENNIKKFEEKNGSIKIGGKAELPFGMKIDKDTLPN
ncbi:DUF3467 domain-containing protein [bacterium]|nr:DUF3467 domain-containing protein [bacterium]MBL7052183.1 DUF3467 domain-containing protein [Candidatus Neomarinimicrobiota bacterium]